MGIQFYEIPSFKSALKDLALKPTTWC